MDYMGHPTQLAAGVLSASLAKNLCRAQVESCSQVYALAIVAQLQRGAEPKANQDLTILVPPYDPARIFRLSYEPDGLAELDMEPDRCVMPLRAGHDAAASLKLSSCGLVSSTLAQSCCCAAYAPSSGLCACCLAPFQSGPFNLHSSQVLTEQGRLLMYRVLIYSALTKAHVLLVVTQFSCLTSNLSQPGSRLSTPEPEALEEKAEEAAGGDQAASQTGLGVAGMLRRIGLWAKEDAARGRITIAGRELLRWKRAADRWPPPACPFHKMPSPYAVVTADIALRTAVGA